jgi:hypothetical protein
LTPIPSSSLALATGALVTSPNDRSMNGSKSVGSALTKLRSEASGEQTASTQTRALGVCRQHGGEEVMTHYSDAIRKPGSTMSTAYCRQSPALTWKRRQRRQRIFGAVVTALLLAAVLYGWLYVFKVF